LKIALIVEGQTEIALRPLLRAFIKTRISGNMPKLDLVPRDGRIPKGELLKKDVKRLLEGGADWVIALTDVYTGQQFPDFNDAEDAKRKMREWVGNERRFFPHAAQFEFEAWLLPFWDRIKKLSESDKACPAGQPEHVNHSNPPSRRIKEAFHAGRKRKYKKSLDVLKILRDENDLAVAAQQCPQLKAFLNTLLALSGAEPLP
jgi:hypothetical protein